MNHNTALVILSGGQDSTTTLFLAKGRYKTVHSITFDYGQRHKIEVEAAAKVAEMAKVASHETIALGPLLKGRSPLTDKSAELERYADYESMDKIIGNRVELTFVPMRNALFLTIAANRAAVLEAGAIMAGICQQDNANYPDCRRVFADSQMETINLALGLERNAIEIITPLMHLSKAQSVKIAKKLPGCWEALAYTHTSYAGDYPPLDRNHASVLRAQGFLEAGEADPLVARAVAEGLMVWPETSNYDELRAA